MKKRLSTLGSLVFLTFSSLYATEVGQVNHGMQNMLLAQGSGNGVKQHQYQYQKKHMYQGTTGQGKMSEQGQGQGKMSEQGQGKSQGNMSENGQGSQSKGNGIKGGGGGKR